MPGAGIRCRPERGPSFPNRRLSCCGYPGAVPAQPITGETLEYSRPLIANGEWWRLLTCHWVHWSVGHALWDALAFAALVLTATRLSLVRTITVLLAASALIPACIWLLLPDITVYRGLSGLASALYAFLIVETLAHTRRDQRALRVVVALAGLGFVAKVVFEVAAGVTLFVGSMGPGIVCVPLAHLVGAATGLAGTFRLAERPPTGRN